MYSVWKRNVRKHGYTEVASVATLGCGVLYVENEIKKSKKRPRITFKSCSQVNIAADNNERDKYLVVHENTSCLDW